MELFENFIGHKSGREGEEKVRELIENGTLQIGVVLVDADGNKTIIEGFTGNSVHLRIYVKRNSINVENKQVGLSRSFMQWDGFDKFGRRIQEEKLFIENGH